ncbi:hypothetical protein ACFZB2_28235 [Streptomyces bobili]|uniref:hypothetical protein n=1 Tax=Streptomyces bobili TaxID=67280 RepID=UPI0036F01451
MRHLRALDARLFARVASAHPVLPWLAGAAVMGLSGNRGARRAALRGTGSLALASAAVAAKSASSHRLRPGPAVRALPSGHPAAVAAFATAVALESPKLGAALISLATAAAVLRARTGTCSPVEVLAGAAVGVGVAAATCRWWPLHVDAPADPPGRTSPSPPFPRVWG